MVFFDSYFPKTILLYNMGLVSLPEYVSFGNILVDR